MIHDITLVFFELIFARRTQNKLGKSEPPSTTNASSIESLLWTYGCVLDEPHLSWCPVPNWSPVL